MECCCLRGSWGGGSQQGGLGERCKLPQQGLLYDFPVFYVGINLAKILGG